MLFVTYLDCRTTTRWHAILPASCRDRIRLVLESRHPAGAIIQVLEIEG